MEFFKKSPPLVFYTLIEQETSGETKENHKRTKIILTFFMFHSKLIFEKNQD